MGFKIQEQEKNTSNFNLNYFGDLLEKCYLIYTLDLRSYLDT